jgi:hypothetical protein
VQPVFTDIGGMPLSLLILRYIETTNQGAATTSMDVEKLQKGGSRRQTGLSHTLSFGSDCFRVRDEKMIDRPSVVEEFRVSLQSFVPLPVRKSLASCSSPLDMVSQISGISIVLRRFEVQPALKSSLIIIDLKAPLLIL